MSSHDQMGVNTEEMVALADGEEVDDATRNAASVARLALTAEERAWFKLHDDGTMDVPLSFLRRAADWVRRYDLRPKAAAKARGGAA